MAPVKPSEFKALIIAASDPPCTAWKKLLKAIYLWYKVKKYEDGEDGGIGEQHAIDICAAMADCPGASTTTV